MLLTVVCIAMGACSEDVVPPDASDAGATVAPEDPARTGGGPPPNAGAHKQAEDENPFSPRVRKGLFRALQAGSSLDLDGAASLIRLPDGETLLNIDIEGLERGSGYEGFLHTAACADGGGERYLFDPSARPSRSNQHGGRFRSDARGEAREVSFIRFVTAGPEAVSVVITEASGGRVACADLKATK
jgi:hypothetical protein